MAPNTPPKDAKNEALEALAYWRPLGETYLKAREDYRIAVAKATIARADMKPAASQKAQVDLDTQGYRVVRDRAELLASEAWQTFLILRGPMAYGQLPGQHFGNGD